MATERRDSVRARAIAWHIRLRDGGDQTWAAFADWLAEDPHHAEIYDEIEQADLVIAPLLPEVTFREAANDTAIPIEGARSPWRLWGLAGGALAASIAAAIAFIPLAGNSRYEVVTGPGQRQIVSLAPGTRVMLNGSTRMTFDRKDPRFASLSSGEALFQVQHDSTRPFGVEVGGSRVEDLGTVFNVVRDAGAIRISVAEGKVLYKSEKDAIPLQAGQALVDPSAAPVRITQAPIGSVGGWDKGSLIYTGEPMSQVAADLGRALGIRITASPEISTRPFYGAIAIQGTGAVQLKRLMPALDVSFEAEDGGWMMKAAGAAR